MINSAREAFKPRIPIPRCQTVPDQSNFRDDIRLRNETGLEAAIQRVVAVVTQQEVVIRWNEEFFGIVSDSLCIEAHNDVAFLIQRGKFPEKSTMFFLLHEVLRASDAWKPIHRLQPQRNIIHVDDTIL